MSQRVASRQRKRVGIVQFFRNVWSELKKVSWPNKKEMMTYTSVVVVSVLIIALIIWFFDSIFSFLVSLVL